MSRNTNVKRLNTKGGANRHRFQGLHERLNNIHINLSSLSIIHDSEYDVIEQSVKQANQQSNNEYSNQTTEQPSTQLINQSRSHFHDALMAQRELHGFELFNLAFAELRPLSQSFPLIVHNRAKIVMILLYYIEQSIKPTNDGLTYHQHAKQQKEQSDNSSMPHIANVNESNGATPVPFLSLLTALAKDLRSEMTAFFPIILTTLLSIIDPSDSDSLEAIFTSLLFLFRFLSKSLVNQIQSIYQSFYVFLMHHPKWWIRKFASESLTFLIRKLSPTQRNSFYDVLLAPVDVEQILSQSASKPDSSEDESIDQSVRSRLSIKQWSQKEHEEGIATLLFYLHKNVQFSLHSITEPSINQLIDFLIPQSSDSASVLRSDNDFAILSAFHRRLANFTRSSHCECVWKVLLDRLKTLSVEWKSLVSQSNNQSIKGTIGRRSLQLSRVIEIAVIWTSHRGGSRIVDAAAIMQSVNQMMDQSIYQSIHQTTAYRASALKWLVAFYSVKHSTPHHSILQLHVQSAFKSQLTSQSLNQSTNQEADIVTVLLPLINSLQHHPVLHASILRHTFSLIDRSLTQSTSQSSSQSISCSDWLTLLMAACQDYQQHDPFFYETRSQEVIDDVIEPPSRTINQSINQSFPSSIIQQLVMIVCQSFKQSFDQLSDAKTADDLHMALQLLCLMPSSVTPALALSIHQTVEQSVDQSTIIHLLGHSPSEYTVNHLLVAAARHYTELANSHSVSQANNQPTLDLFVTLPFEPSFSSRVVTTPLIDRMLYLATRALVSHHILVSQAISSSNKQSVSQSHNVLVYLQDVIGVEKAHHLSLIDRWPSHPAVLRPLLSYLRMIKQLQSVDSLDKALTKTLNQCLSVDQFTQFARVIAADLSHPSPPVRLAASHILSVYPPLPFEQSTTQSNKQSTAQSCFMMRDIDEFSSLKPSLPNERMLERPLKNLELLAVSKQLPAVYQSILTHFFLGVLSIKLTSIWPSAQKGLASLLSSNGQTVWPIVKDVFKQNNLETRALAPQVDISTDQSNDVSMEQSDDSSKDQSTDDSEEPADETEEEEDVVDASDDLPTLSAAFSEFCRIGGRSTDSLTMHSLLMRTLSQDECRSFAEEHAIEQCQDFLIFFHSQYQTVFDQEDRSIEPPEVIVKAIQQSEQSNEELVAVPQARRIARVKLLQFMRYFNAAIGQLSKLGPFRQYFSRFFYRLMTDIDTEVQDLAIDCLNKFHFMFLTPYVNNLHRLIDEKTFREELTTFSLDYQSNYQSTNQSVKIVPEHRLPLTAILIRVLYPKLMLRKLKHNKSSINQRRATILAFLAGMQGDEAANLLHILIQPFLPIVRMAAGTQSKPLAIAQRTAGFPSKKALAELDYEIIMREITPELPTIESFTDALNQLSSHQSELEDQSLRRQTGFLHMLEVLLGQLRTLVKPYLPIILVVLLHLLERTNTRIEDLKTKINQSIDEEDEDVEMPIEEDDSADVDIRSANDAPYIIKQLRSIRQLIYSRFAFMLETYHADFTVNPSDKQSLLPFLYRFLALSKQSILGLSKENTQHRGGLLQMLAALASQPHLLPILLDLNGKLDFPMLPSLFQLLGARHVSTDVINSVLGICQHMLGVEQAARDVELSQQRRTLPKIERKGVVQSNGTFVSFEDSDDDEPDAKAIVPKLDVIIKTNSARTENLAGLSEAEIIALGGLVSRAWKLHVSVFLTHMYTYMDALSNAPIAKSALHAAHIRAIKSSIDAQNKYDPRFRRTAGKGMNIALQMRRPFPRRELEVIAAVSSYATDGDTASKLLDLLVPLLVRMKDMRERDAAAIGRTGSGKLGRAATQLHLLTVIRDCVRLIDHPEKHVSILSRQLMLIRPPANRSMLAQVFMAMATNQHSNVLEYLLPVATLLIELTYVNGLRIDEVDFDRIIEGYRSVLMRADDWTINQLNPFINTILYDMNSTELGLRTQASQALTAIIDRFAREVTEQTLDRPAAMFTDIIFPAIRRGIVHSDEGVRREWLRVFGHVVRAFPVFLAIYLPLINENHEVDFFTSIGHIQRHRRIRAFARLMPLIESQAITSKVAVELLLPMALNTVLESSGAKESLSIDEPKRYSKSAAAGGNQSNNQGLIDECVVVIGALSGLLEWTQYQQLVSNVIRLIKKHPAVNKILVRTVCVIIDRWHFEIAKLADLTDQERDEEHQTVESINRKAQARLKEIKAANAKEVQAAPVVEAKEEKEEKDEDDASLSDEDEDGDAMEVDEAAEAAASAKKLKLGVRIRSSLTRLLLPQLQHLLSTKIKGTTEPVIRPQVAIAIVTLMKKLPEDFFELHFPRLLTLLLTEMTRREQIPRDTARRVIVDCLEIVGAEHTPAFVGEASALLTRGFQRHALGYLVYCLFERLAHMKLDQTGLVDVCVNQVMRIVVNDLTGEVGREKEIDAIRRVGREARTRKANDLLEHLAALVSFTALHEIIEPLNAELVSSPDSATMKSVREGLKRVADGVIRNKSIESKQLLVYIYRTIKQAAVTSTGESVDPSKDQSTNPSNQDSDYESEDEKLTERERSARRRKSKDAAVAVQSQGRVKITVNQSKQSINRTRSSVMAHFGLSLLLAELKEQRLAVSDPSIIAMLDPWLSFIGTQCLGLDLKMKISDHTITQSIKQKKKSSSSLKMSDEVVSVSLKVMQRLLKIHSLPSINQFVPVFTVFVFDQLIGGSPAMKNVLFTTLSAVLHECSSFSLSVPHVEVLLDLLSAELAVGSSIDSNSGEGRASVVLELLHGIISRRLVSPKLYDVVDRLSTLFVTHPNAAVQTRASQLVLMFLLDYPLGAKRLQQHLLFIVNQLEYTVLAGRLAALTLLSSLITRFPSSVCETQLELLFFPLLLVLANDTSDKCRAQAAQAIKSLIIKLGQEKRDVIVKWLQTWLADQSSNQSADQSILARQCAAMQCYGLLVESSALDIKAVAKLGSIVRRVLTNANNSIAVKEEADESIDQPIVEESDNENDEDMNNEETDQPVDDAVKQEDESEPKQEADENKEHEQQLEQSDESQSLESTNDWRLVYQSLIVVEKCVHACQTESAKPSKQSNKPAVQQAIQSMFDRSLLSVCLALGRAPHSWIQSVVGRVLGATLTSDVIRSLYDCSLVRGAVQLCTLQLSRVDLTQAMSEQVINNTVVCVRLASDMDWSQEQQAVNQSTKQADDYELSEELSKLYQLVDMSFKRSVLTWLFTRLSYVCRQEGNSRRANLLSLFTRVVRDVPVTAWMPYLLSFLNPAFRIANATNVRGVSAEQVKTNATALLDDIQTQVGATIFLPYYQYVRNSVMNVRLERKQKRKALAVTNPEVAAKMKKQKVERAKTSRKRTVEAMKIGKQGPGITAKLIERMKEQRGTAAQSQKNKKRKQ